MDILHSIILGVVEGLTEFLPVSSTFHLIFTSRLFGLPDNNFLKLFEVFIQAGAILAVLTLYFKDFVKNRDLMKNIIISFVPTMIIGFALYKIIKNVFFEAYIPMVIIFTLVCIIFIIVELLIKQERIKLKQSISTLTVKQSLMIGLFQSLAVMPGVSRSGAVMVGMMLMGLKRDESAKYSFMLSVPTIVAASAYDLFKMRHEITTSSNNLLLLIIGFITAFIVAYFVIRWFIGYLKGHSLIAFGFYRIGIVVILLALGLVQ